MSFTTANPDKRAAQYAKSCALIALLAPRLADAPEAIHHFGDVDWQNAAAAARVNVPSDEVRAYVARMIAPLPSRVDTDPFAGFPT